MAQLGKGCYIWKITNCENGDPSEIALVAKNAGFTHVLIKIADGTAAYHGIWGRDEDLISPVVVALHGAGIQVYGWHYCYGDNPAGEADLAARRITYLKLDGYVIDAEQEYKADGKRAAAKYFMNRLKSNIPDVPVALSSYRFPSLHPQFPWSEFLDGCDFNMPQVYWVKAHNPAEQLIRTIREFQKISPSRPIIPTGAAYYEHGWVSSPGEVLEFLHTAKSLHFGGVNFWEWSFARSNRLSEVWETIETFPWSDDGGTSEICESYITALNTHDSSLVINLYAPKAIHISAARIVQGLEAIQNWYKTLFTTLLPDAQFTLTGYLGNSNTRRFTWTAKSVQGIVQNGNDTISLVNDKINYHYSFFTIEKSA